MDRLMRLVLPLTLCLAGDALPRGLIAAEAQEQTRRHPECCITIDEDILRAFAGEPDGLFASARTHFLAGQQAMAARKIRIAAAHLQLQSARATVEGRVSLDASIRELQQLAAAIERGEIRLVETLQQAFSRAHFALAVHYCAKCATCAKQCCDRDTSPKQIDGIRTGYDLKAATDHLRQGSIWAHGGIGEDTRAIVVASQLTASRLIEQSKRPNDELARAVDALHGKLERLTGRKIMIAPPVIEDDGLAPAAFR